MPIRVTDDNSSENENTPNDNGSKRQRTFTGGGGGLGALLPMLMSLVFKNPKVGIPLLLIIGLFLYFGKGCGNIANADSQNKKLATGCEMKREIYDKAEQFEKLDESYNPLPEAVSLQKYCPPVGDQGTQGSCVGWSSSYAARSILHTIKTGDDPTKTIFSPAFLYNQIGLEGCQGAYINNAMQTLHQVGDLPINLFPYDENDCSRLPNSNALAEAEKFKIKGFNRLSKNSDEYGVDILAIKQNLAQGAPVVIGMSVGGSFMQMMGQEMWIPTDEDYQKDGFGGHAMCVVGYDDYKEYDGQKVGAFLIMNSWGKQYGKDGFIWVPYKVFQKFVNEAYGLYPMGKAHEEVSQKLKVDLGIVDVKSKMEFKLKKTKEFQYSTQGKIAPGTKFRLKITNSAECYTYVFGMETDGSSYVLFPYTAKHSPYCGITGTRTFPKDKFLEPDNIGNKDYFGIVVSPQPIDFIKVKTELSKHKNKPYHEQFTQVFGNDVSTDFKVNNSDNISFTADISNNKLAFVVVEVNK